MLKRDFTLEAYANLVNELLAAGYQCYRVRDALDRNGDLDAHSVILRHDVDRWPGRALGIAAVEAGLNVHSSFYVRPSRSTFAAGVVRALDALGHEVGYHYETLSLTHGDMATAIALFHEELGKLRALAPVHTCAMHGSPLSPHNNLDIWNGLTLREADLIGEAFLAFQEVPELLYLSDTGRSWGNRNNMRDKLSGHMIDSLTSTDSLIQLIRTERPRRLYLATHPERWLSHPVKWTVQLAFDTAANVAKRVLWTVRRPAS